MKKINSASKLILSISIFLGGMLLSCSNQILVSGLPHLAHAKAARHADNPIYYIGEYYYGKEKGGSGKLSPVTSQSQVRITSPDVTDFNADGFFTISGSVNNSAAQNYMLLKVQKNGTSYKAQYFLEGTFNQRIWLPFGSGEYTISGIELTSITKTGDPQNAEISGWGYIARDIFTLRVTNTRNEDGRFLYPSYYVQSDNEAISQFALDVTRGKVHPVDKVKAVHDAVCALVTYDNASVAGNGANRKKQDALTVLKLKLGVCEGYASLTSAMLRSLGIRTKSVCGYANSGGSSGLHAWTHVEVRKDGVKKYYFMDPTWDDQYTVLHKYFLLDLEQNEYNNRGSHLQGCKDAAGNSLGGDDGKDGGTRPWRLITDDTSSEAGETTEVNTELAERFPLVETLY